MKSPNSLSVVSGINKGLIGDMVILFKSRVKYVFVWAWPVAVSGLLASRGSPPLLPFLLSIASMAFLSASVYIYNDIIDSEYDKYHFYKKKRPIPSGIVSANSAYKVVPLFGVIGLAISFLININTFMISFIYFLLLVVYSHPKTYLKSKMFVKEGMLSLCLLLTSLIGSYSVIKSFSMNAFFPIMIFTIFGFMAQPAITDTIDMEQDQMHGVRTLASVLSWRRKMELLITGVLLVMTLTPFTYIYLNFNILLPILVTFACLLFLRYMFPFINHVEKSDLLKADKYTLIYFTAIQLMFVLGSLKFNFF